MKKIFTAFQKLTVLSVIFSMIMWSFGIGNLNFQLPVQTANAATNFNVNNENLPNSDFMMSGIGLESSPYAIAKMNIWTDLATASTSAITAVFGGSGFSTSTLAALGIASSSGVAIYDDSGSMPGILDETDSVVILNTPPSWTGSSTVTFSDFVTPLSLSQGATTTLYLVIKTSATATDGTQIIATIPTNGIVTTDGNGPSSPFVSAPYDVDGVAPTITAVEMINNNTVEVVFSEPIMMAGNSAYYSLSGGLTVTSAQVNGPNIVQIQSDGDIVVDSTQLTASADISDMAGNANATTDPVTVTAPARIKISEVSAMMGSADSAEFIELYNSGSAGVDINGWKVQYSAPANGSTWTDLAEVSVSTTIPAGGFYLFSTLDFDAGSPTDGDMNFTATLDNTGGHVRIYDASNVKEIDKVGWGTAVNPEARTAYPLMDNKSIERKAFGMNSATDLASGGMDETMGNGWDTGDNSFDFVLQSEPLAQNSLSAPEMPDYSGFDGGGPMIFHMPINKAPTGSDLNVYAQMGDPMTPISEISARLYYMIGDGSPSDNTPDNYTKLIGTHQTNGIFKFTIPSADIDSSTVNGLYYYLKVSTANGGDRYMSANPNADMANDVNLVAQNPFIVNCVAEGTTYLISGTVNLDATSTNAGVLIILEGTGYATTTGESGNYEINAPNGVYNLAMFKTGYYEEWINNVFVNGANVEVSEKTLYVGTGGGVSGDSTKPMVMWNMPKFGDTNIPTDENFKIVVGLSKAMDESTISSSTVILTTGGIDTPVSGYSYAYNPTRENWMPSEATDPYILVISPPAGGLAPGTKYYVVLTGNMRDTAGNSLSGNRPEGGHEFSFTTSFDTSQYDFGTGGNMPPFVMDVKPYRGAINIPLNSRIALTFSEMMDTTTVLSGNYIKLYAVSVDNDGVESSLQKTVSASLDTTGKIVILTPDSALDQSQKYRIIVYGGMKSSAGVYMASDGASTGANTEVYRSSFVTGSVSDSSAPTVLGSWPSDNDTGIAVNPGMFNVQFSENLDPSTVNSNTVTLKRGTTLATTEIKYDSQAQSVNIVPQNILANGTTYTLTLTGSSSSGIKDVSGNMLASSYIVTFTTTATGDTLNPEIMFANGDDFGLAVTFNEPMKASGMTDAANWPYSVLNPNNYIIKWGDPSTVVAGGLTIDLAVSGAQFNYDSFNNTVMIENLGLDPNLVAGKDYYVDMSSGQASDLSGNYIASGTFDTFQMPINSSMDTYGMLGPGDMIDPEMGDMGMMMAGAFPMNSMAGQKTVYFVDVPIASSIPSGGKIAITFPQGFNIDSAAKDPYSPINNDINEWNEGVITIASVATNTSRTITVTTGGSATQANDFLHFDLSGIVNSSIPRGYETSGYSVDIKTLDASGNLIENINTMPFYITASGNGSLTVTAAGLDMGDVGADDQVYVFLGSPMTGPMEKIIIPTVASSTVFSGLPEGQYYVFTEPTVSLTGGDYSGISMPEPIMISGAVNKTITFVKEGTGSVAEITVDITGEFGTDAIDVFAGSPNGFKVKTISPAGSNPSATLYLPDGEWMVGMGPAMPKNSMSGPPPMPDWMPPAPVRVVVGEGGATVIESSATANDGTIAITVPTADIQIIGYVKDGSNNAISSAEVFAYQPGGTGMGSHTKTDTNGKFVLKVSAAGNYKVGTFKPGLSYVPERSVLVKAEAGADDGNGTADIYRDSGSLISLASPFVIKMSKPNYTISGKLTDGTNPVSYAPVWADNSSSFAHVDTMTDASGNYILYVDNGTWNVNAYVPNYGNADTQTVIVNGENETQNLAPDTTTTYVNLSGTVSDGSAIAYQPIRAVQFNDSGVYTGKEFSASTDSNGNYTISVPANNKYRIDIWTKNYGEIGLDDDEDETSPANVIVAGVDRSSLDITVDTVNLRTITLNFANATAGQEGFLNVEGVEFDGNDPKPNGFQYHTHISDLTATNTIQLKAGDYFFFVYVPGLGEFIPDDDSRDNTKDDIVVGLSDRDVNFTLTDISSGAVTISGTVYDTEASGGNELADTWVWVGNPANGYRNGTQTNDLGYYSLTVPIGNGYKMGADKPGYMSKEPTDLNASVDATRNFVLNSYNLSISGYIYADANSNNSYDTGEELPTGFVRAETIECADSDTTNDSNCVKSHSPVDGSGAYELGVTAGTWKIYGMSDGYSETYYGTEIEIDDLSVSGKNIKLNENANWTSASKKKPITPSSGGSLDDTAPGGTGVKLTIPPNAMGNSSSAGNVNTKKTSSVTETNSTEPVGGQGVNVTATDNSGQSINNLNDYIDLEMVMYKSEVDQAISDGELTYAKLKSTKNGYWDSTNNDWVNLTTTRKAYYKVDASDTEWILYSNNGTSTASFVAFINEVQNGSLTPGDYKLVFSSKTNHFTIFAVIMPFIVQAAAPDPEPEPDPVIPSSGGGGSYTSYCVEVEYGEWNLCEDGIQSREVISKTPSSCRLTATQESDKTRFCEAELETELETEETFQEKELRLISEKTLSEIDSLYLEQGEFIYRAEINEILPALNMERNHVGERLSRTTLSERLGIKLNDLEPRHQYALTNYITYGSPDTAKLGWGERAGVLNSFKSAFDKLPETADDWSDIIKIANGRWPTQRSEAAEGEADKHFKKIYLRDADRLNPHDDAAVTVIAYGLRPAHRNAESEKAGIRIFKAIYGYNPTSAVDWDIVRAIAYSGASR